MSQLHYDVGLDLKQSELINVTEELFQTYSGVKSTYKEVHNYLEQRGLSIDNLYQATSGFYTFWYIDEYVFISLFSINTEDLDFFQLVERVQAQKDTLKKYWNNQQYESFFGLVEKQFTLDVFQQVYEQIPVEHRYSVFVDLYTRNDYGFHRIDPLLVREILNTNKGRIEENYFDTDEEGYVTIFRGMQEKSAPPETAYSWTIDLAKAEFFATRFNSIPSQIYTAKVHYTNIIDYITTRNESEVIVLPEDLKNIQDLNYLNFDDTLVNTLEAEGYLNDYHYHTRRLQSTWFHNPNGIHGIKHIKRVLMHTLIMSYEDKLSQEDKRILTYASLYHDIGRTNEDYDLHHGKQSVDKMKQLKLPTRQLTKDERLILEFIMEYHAKPDDSGLRRLKKTGIIDKARAQDLFLRFKDCDGLDRVRLRDLKIKYLRTETAKKMLLIAHQLLRNIDW